MAHKNRMDSSHSPLDMNPYSPQAVRRVNHFSVSGSPSELCAHPFSYITYLLLRLQWLHAVRFVVFLIKLYSISSPANNTFSPYKNCSSKSKFNSNCLSKSSSNFLASSEEIYMLRISSATNDKT